MSALDLYSEPFAATGGIDARSARRAIGKPTVGFWELFLRETLQNSWDARRGVSIAYRVNGFKLDYDQMAILHDEVFAIIPSNAYALRERLASRTFRLLVVSDSGTHGLGGATRADVAQDATTRTDFVDFIRNIGRAEKKTLGGGTYGFGKGVLYDASDVDSCLVYSQTIIDGLVENRFIAVSVGDELVSEGNRFTGRHWWGVQEDAGILEPLRGARARELALSLGLTSLAPDETGTSIAVIDPVLGQDEKLPDVVNALSEAALLWAWPHMLDRDSLGPSIRFEFAVGGEALALPDPSSDPQFAQFARAFEHASKLIEDGRANNEWPWSVKPVESLRPKYRLGALAYRGYTPPVGIDAIRYPRHVALMRDPLFIVKYLEVPEDPNGQALAGVFLADPAQNKKFAKAEPVAHDDWIPSALGLTTGETNPVRLALNKIRDEFKTRTSSGESVVGEEHSAGIASLSRQFGSLLTTVTGTGAEISSGSPGGGGGGGRRPSRREGVSVSQQPDVQLIVDGSRTVACFSFSIASTTGTDLNRFQLTANPMVVLDGGVIETEPPVGSEQPEILGWYFGDELLSDETHVPASKIRSGSHVMRVSQPAGTAIALDIRVEHVDAIDQ